MKRKYHRNLIRNIMRTSPVGADKRRLKRELGKVPDVSRYSAYLGGAFRFDSAPQGHKFWSRHVNWAAPCT